MKTGIKQIFMLLALCGPLLVAAQHIIYSEPEREDGRRTNYEIIGKIGGNILVFKDNRSDIAISVYDQDLKLQNRVKIDFFHDRYINVYFVPYANFFYMFYEYQHKSIVHFAVVKMDGTAKRLAEPTEIDTTQIGFASNNKIYTTIFSEDKQRIMVFKISSKNPFNYLFTTFLYNQDMELVDRHRIYLPMQDRENAFTDFHLDNEGTLVFGKFLKNNGGNYISDVNMVTKEATADSFLIRDAGTGDRYLDELKIKVDNINKHYILSGFYYKQKHGDIEGIYSFIWDKASGTKIKESLVVLKPEMRSLAKSSESNQKMAFNDYFIKQLIVKRDGGFILISESQFNSSRGGYFNRWDNMYGYNPYFGTGMGYYNSPFYNPYRYGYGNNAVRFHAENIMINSFDKDGNEEWSNIVPKTQYDDEAESTISYLLMNTGGELHFLYNQFEGRNLLLNDQSIGPDGKIMRYPTLKNLDKGYDFMPRDGRQIGSKQILIPCLYRNYLCFAKIDF